ncbi:MAG: hypothetical protein RLP45_14675, partial [Haliea sp.]
MTNFTFPPVFVNFDADKLASEFTLLAKKINAANRLLLDETSSSRVEATKRAAAPENGDLPLRSARHGTASDAGKVAGRHRQAPRGDNPEAAPEQEAAGEAIYFQDDQGMWVIEATLPREAGASLIEAIEA